MMFRNVGVVRINPISSYAGYVAVCVLFGHWKIFINRAASVFKTGKKNFTFSLPLLTPAYCDAYAHRQIY
jgi:hypothetical protein